MTGPLQSRLFQVGLAGLGLGGGLALFVALQALLPVPTAATAADRIALAAAALLPGIAVLAAMLLVQMGLRFTTGALDPTAGGDSRALTINRRAIANTVEQLAVFAPSLLAAAAAAADLSGVLALALVFATGRLVFWAGYALDPLARTPGMAASGGAALAALVWAASVWTGRF